MRKVVQHFWLDWIGLIRLICVVVGWIRIAVLIWLATRSLLMRSHQLPVILYLIARQQQILMPAQMLFYGLFCKTNGR